jgi:2-dehydro-3-deoxyphosphogluconate aldolase/(4S)-4-hydroxy-2-oxoglutarate aldolase
VIDQLKLSPVVPVFFHPDTDYSKNIVRACYDGGIRFFEFTNRGPEAYAVFRALTAFVREHCPGLSLGIGTIYTAEEAARFIDAGADFVVQPVTTPEVAAVCRDRRKPWIPGALTPNEIWSAWQLGAAAVKVFPGSMVGPAYIQALRGPLPDVPLMVTGGVEPTAAGIAVWLNAGVQAVGLGSQLFKGDFSGDWSGLVDRISALTGALKY